MSTVLVVVEIKADKEEADDLSKELETLIQGEVTRALVKRPSANLTKVAAIVKNDKGETLMDEYIRQEVIKAKEKLNA